MAAYLFLQDWTKKHFCGKNAFLAIFFGGITLVFSWLKGKPIPAPTDLELELVEALEAVTECVEEKGVCIDAANDGRETLDRAKEALGIDQRQQHA